MILQIGKQVRQTIALKSRCQIKEFSLLLTAMPFASVNYGSGAPQASQFVTLLALSLRKLPQLPFVRLPQACLLHLVRCHAILLQNMVPPSTHKTFTQRHTYLFAKASTSSQGSVALASSAHSSKLRQHPSRIDSDL
jgi:hypothetical protein